MMTFRRLVVFFLGGFICPACGWARVKPFADELDFFGDCPKELGGCGKIYVRVKRLARKTAWKMVWKWRQQ